MKIDGKTQPQRVYELMYWLFRNEGESNSASKLGAKYHLDPKLITFMQSKGIVERASKRGAIYWSTKEPDLDMAIHTARAFNKWLSDRRKAGDANDIPVVADEVYAKAEPDHRVLGYRFNILGLKFEIRKPVFRVEKIRQPFAVAALVGLMAMASCEKPCECMSYTYEESPFGGTSLVQKGMIDCDRQTIVRFCMGENSPFAEIARDSIIIQKQK